ncbi:MAG: tetratricopeptide repeat protein [Bacteroidota bacterium]
MKKGAQPKSTINHEIVVKPSVNTRNHQNNWLPWVVVAALLIITGSLYQSSIKNHFTNWDDNVYVLENTQVKEFGAQNIWYFFTHSSAGNYHPFTMLSLSIDYQLARKAQHAFSETSEPEAGYFHLTSLAFHLLNVILVFIFIYLLSRKQIIVATVTALLFAIHPLHVESVAWISERKDVLYSFFFLSGLILYLKYLEKKGWMRLLVIGLLFLASLLSKPSAVVFPLILLSIDYFHGRKFTATVFLEKIPFFIIAFVFGMITTIIQGHVAAAGLQVFTIFQRVMFASYGFIMYPFNLLFPFNLSAFYPYPNISLSGELPLIFYLSPLIAVFTIGLVIYSTRFTKVFGFGYLFYFFTIVLVLQFLPVGNAIMADRYSYISSIGIFFIIAWFLNKAMISHDKRMRSLRWIFTGVFLLYSFFLGKTAYEQTKVWNNSETLWTNVISKYPGAYVAYENRGNYYVSKNDFDKAMLDYLSYVQIRQDNARVYNNLGNGYKLKGENEKAIKAYSKSIALDSLDQKPRLNRAVLYSISKQYNLALNDYTMALKINPALLEVYISRSVMFRDMSRYENAIVDLSQVIRYLPGNADYFLDRGFCYFMIKKYPEALNDFEKSITLKPDNGHAFYNISAIYNEMKDYSKAYEYAIKAKSFNYPVSQSLLETLKKKIG